MATAAENKAFEFLDSNEQGLLVAWRRKGTAPEFSSRGRSRSGAQHVLVAGRIEAPYGSPDEFAEALEGGGSEVLDSVAGPCVIFAWHDQERTHTLFRPESGQRVVCYAQLAGGVIFASDARTLSEHPEVDTDTNWSGVAEHLAFGHLFGEKTLFRGITRLEAGTQLTIVDGQARSLRKNPELEPLSGSRSSHVDRVDAALHDAVEAAWAGADRPALCLSAGLDSRTLMAVAHRREIPLTCVTNGIEGSIELRLTKRMCEAIGAEHLRCLLGKEVVARILGSAEDVVAYTDGEGTIQSANMLFVTRKYRDELHLDRAIRGIGGELLKLSLAYGYSLPPELAKAGGEDALQRHLLGQLLNSANKSEWQSLRGDLAEALVEGPEKSFRHAWNSLEGFSGNPADKVSLLFLRAYIARATVDSMRVLRQSVDLAQPFLDERFIRTLLSVPVEMRLDQSLQIELIRRNTPELLRIPDSTIRAPLDAGRLHRWVANMAQRVAGRLGFGQIDVPEKWLVAKLDDFFQSTLLEERSLGRQHIDPDGMRDLLSTSETERAQSRVFLGRLTTLELHLRNLESPAPDQS